MSENSQLRGVDPCDLLLANFTFLARQHAAVVPVPLCLALSTTYYLIYYTPEPYEPWKRGW